MLNDPCNELVHHLPHVFYSLTIDSTYAITFVSRQSFQLLGYLPIEFEGQECSFFQRIIHKDDFELVRKAKGKSLDSKGLVTMNYRMISKSNSIRQVTDQWVSYRSADNHSWIIEGRVSITETANVRSKLLHQLKAYRDAVDVNMISSITDTAGKIIYANENFCRISKYPITELVGQNHRIIRSGHHSKSFFEEMWDTISSGNRWQGEILNKAKDGTLYWVDTVIIPVFDDQRKIVKYLSLRMLINDRKQSELQQHSYTQLLERIAFIVAHDIRGPLCSILGLVHILLDHKMPKSEARVALEYLNEAAMRLQEITKKLSQFVFENEIELKVKSFAEQIRKSNEEEDEDMGEGEIRR